FLLRNQTHGDGGEGEKRRSRNPFVRLQQGFERGFEAVRQRYIGLLHLGLRKRGWLIGGFLAAAAVSFGLTPFLGSNFFPNIDSGEIHLHARGRPGFAWKARPRLPKTSRPRSAKLFRQSNSEALSPTSANRSRASTRRMGIRGRLALRMRIF